MDLRATGYRVVIRPLKLEDVDEVFKNNKLIHIPKEFQELKREQNAIDTGIVENIGPSAFADEDPWFSVGDQVYFAKYAGKAIERDGVRYLVMKDDDVLAVLEKADV